MSPAAAHDDAPDSTAGSTCDIAVFPSTAAELALNEGQPDTRPGRPLVPLAVAFAVGIALAPAVATGSQAWAGAALLALGGGILAPRLRRPALRWPLLAVAFVCLGAQTATDAVQEVPPHHLRRVAEEALAAPARVEGWVVVPPDPHPPDLRDSRDAYRARFTVEVTHLTVDGRRVPTTGRARLTVMGPVPELRYGDEVQGSFRLRHPRRFDNPGAFDYPAYLAAQGIFLEGWTRQEIEVRQAGHGSRLLAAILRLRTLLLQRLDAAMPPAEAGLLKAVVLGDRSGLTPGMTRAFLDSGTYHIVAISGLNVSLLAGTLFGLLRLFRVPPGIAAGASAVLVTVYAVLAGAGASVTRAAVMADVYLLAIVLDRRADVLNSLALSALALLWWNPRFLGDVGFQLTFLATLGIILIVPACDRRLVKIPRLLRWGVDSMALTMAATAVTLPILAASFNRVSPAGLIANVAIVPLSGLITGLGTAACAFFLAVPTGLFWLNTVNGWLVDALFHLARWFGGWPWSSVRVYTPTVGMLLCYYAALALLLASVTGRPRAVAHFPWRRWCRWGAVGCSLLLAAQVSWRLVRPGDDGRIRLTMLDVGQGESIFIEAPGNGRMLVDAGGMFGDGFDVGERVIAPFLWHEWVPRLDVVVATHPQSDHIGGLPAILRTFSVGEVWTEGSSAVSAADVWIQEYLRDRRVPHRVVAAGDPPLSWGDTRIRVLHPGPAGRAGAPRDAGGESRPNDRSMVLRVEVGDQAVLLVGDLERNGEAALLRSGATLAAHVLKVPHHGSRQSSTDAFVRAVRPHTAVISVGHRNPFRHPHPDVMARYRAAGVGVWRTDHHGAIRIDMTSTKTTVSGRRNGPHPRDEGGKERTDGS